MATFPPQLTADLAFIAPSLHADGPRRRCSRLLALASIVAASLIAAPGCSLDQVWLVKDIAPKSEQPCQIVTTWVNKVQFAPDTAHNGEPMPGLVGRMYLFGPTVGFPMVGDGGIFVELFDETQGPSQHPIEKWQIDPVSLRKLVQKDRIGMGYTLFLPWGSYRPDINRVRLTCRYDPQAGTPIYAEPATVSLDTASAMPPVASSQPPVMTPPAEPPTPRPQPLTIPAPRTLPIR